MSGQHSEKGPVDTSLTLCKSLIVGAGPSNKEAMILDLLASRGELYGLAMVQASEGELRRGTIYVTLQRMEQKGYVESWLAKDGTGPARRRYRLTTGGKRVLKAAQMMRSALSWQSNP